MLAQAVFFFSLAFGGSADEVQYGREVFHFAGLGKNGVSCAQCHTLVEEEKAQGDGLIRAGHSLFGVARRRYWRGDTKKTNHPTLADAVDVCVELFQGGEPLTGRERSALETFLASLGPKSGQRPPLEIKPSLEANMNYDRQKYHGGSVANGRMIFFRACHTCHPGGKSGLGPAIRGAKLGTTAKKIREGNGLLRGSRRSGEWMPFFGLDRLTDAQVGDVAVYLSTLRK